MFRKSKLKKITAILTVLLFFAGYMLPLKAFADTVGTKTFDLIEVTDFHGSLVDSSNNPVAGVLSKDIKDVKASNPDRTLIMGGGDLYQGSPVSNVLKGVPVQKVMSNLGMEVTALGNHEFDWGLNTITDTTMKGASYQIICSNLYNKNTGKRVFDPYKIITKDGIKIGIIGAITTETPSIVLPANVSDYNFTDPAKEINSLVPEVKAKGADVVLVLIHEGTNVPDTKTGPVYDIASKLNGVDAVFGGHSHTIAYYRASNGIPVYIAQSNGKGFIDAKMTVDANKKVNFTCDKTSFIAINNKNNNGYMNPKAATDPDAIKIVSDAQTQVGPIFNEVLGTTSNDLTRMQDVKPYGESYLGNWTADVIKEAAKADVGIQNNGGIRIDIPKGDITVGTIYYLMPFDNEVCWVNMTKAQLKVVLEQAFMDGGKGIQFSGIKVTYDYSRPSMDRVINIMRDNGAEIKDGETLKVATNDFMMTGGDGFKGFVDAGGAKNNLPVNDTHTLVRDALIDNVRANKGINTNMDSRITNNAKTISIVGTSDVHGNILPIDYSTGKESNVGLAKISTYVNNLRKANPYVMLVDSGDIIQGTPLSYYFDKVDTTSEYPMMKAMGAMKYDSLTLGNHEFNYGLGTLNRVISDAKKEGINVLGANIYNSDNTNYVTPYFIKEMTVNGKTIKIGILGLTTKCIPNWESADNYKGLHFNDLVDEAKKWVPEMKAAGADIVIATMHSGEESPADTIPENEVKAVVGNVRGIDAVICGHAHSTFAHTLKNPDGKEIPVTEPGKWGQNVSQLDITVNANGNVTGIADKVVKMDSSIPADPEIVKLAQPYEDKTIAYINTVIGKSTGEFSGAGQTVKDTALMDLINEVQRKYAGTQLSIAAPLSASAYIPSGDIKIKDLYSVYVFENFLYGIKMNGAQLRAWLEYSARYYKQTTSGTDKVEKDSKLDVPDYNLDILYGATYDIDLTKPACQVDKNGKVIASTEGRIRNLKYNGKTIKDTDEFTVAINNYRFNGGGGFMKAAGLIPGDTSIVMYDSAKKLGDDGQVRSLMIKYIQDSNTITPVVSNNWEVSAAAVADKPDAEITPVIPTGTLSPAKPAVTKPLPKTGSMIDSSILFGIGSLLTLSGAAIFIKGKKKDKEA